MPTPHHKKNAIILALVCALTVCFYGWVWGSRTAHIEADAAATGTAADTSKHFRWRLITTWPKNFPGLGTAPENFASLINTMSSGRLTVEVYGAGEIVPALQVFDAVSAGTAEMGHSAAFYWKGKIPAAVFFTAVPFGMTAQEQNGWLFHGGGLALWHKAYKPFGLVPFPGGNTGVQMAGWFNRELHTLDDLKGLKMRIPGLAGEVFTRAGGTAVTVPGGELYTALQTGVIDATEWVGPANDVAFGFHRIARYYYYPGWQEPGDSLEFIINQQAWDSLPADLQAMVTAATRTINQDMMDEYVASNSRVYQQVLNDPNVEVRPYPQAILRELKRISGEIMAETAADDALFAEVYASHKAFLEKAAAYTAISEQAFVETRDWE